MRPRAPTRARRAFSLFEALAVIIMVAIAIPPMASIAQSRAASVSDASRRHVATHLAVGVTEAILADVESASPRLGFEGLARGDYLTAAADGVRTRLAAMAAPGAAMGITYDVTIGSPVDIKGKAAAFNAQFALRLITVTASWTSATGTPLSLEITTMVVNR